jgi:hypothetical protein
MPGTLKLKSDAGGSISLAANTTAASDLTVSVPPFAATMATLVANTTGPVFSVPNVAGNGPAFNYTASTTASLSTGVQTKLPYVTKVFDTANCVSSSRFTPNVAGYYQINATAAIGGTLSSTYVLLYIFKNGSVAAAQGGGVSSGYIFPEVSGLFYANGTTDYFEVYMAQNSGSTQSSDSGVYIFSGFLARAA